MVRVQSGVPNIGKSMKKSTVIKASEDEILKLLQKRFDKRLDSIVALEELGNEIWCVEVEPVTEMDELLVEEVYRGDYQFKTTVMLNILCSEGLLEAGDYEIDCRW